MIYKDAPPSATPTEIRALSLSSVRCVDQLDTRLKYSSNAIEEKFRGDWQYGVKSRQVKNVYSGHLVDEPISDKWSQRLV